MRILIKSRLGGRVTDKNLDYEGSITIDSELMKASDILDGEQVHILNRTNGERFITYAMEGKGICLNGAAARKGEVGDELIILTYEIR